MRDAEDGAAGRLVHAAGFDALGIVFFPKEREECVCLGRGV